MYGNALADAAADDAAGCTQACIGRSSHGAMQEVPLGADGMLVQRAGQPSELRGVGAVMGVQAAACAWEWQRDGQEQIHSRAFL